MVGDGKQPLRALLRWYRRHGRDLPWRKTKNPYHIFVSEIMLQQTQVQRVIPYYERWLKQFPTWQALAKATQADVIRAWSGLGYNRRALHMRDAAKQVVAHGVPRSQEEWQQMKGVGAYTSAALSIFTLGKPVLPIDTNIRRVLGRVYLGRPFATPAADQRLKQLVEPSLTSLRAFADVPQALFDLANDNCGKQPDCSSCPLQRSCHAALKFLSGNVRIPRRSIAKSVERIHSGKKYPDRIYRGRILKLVHTKQGGVRVSELGLLIDARFDGKRDNFWLRQMLGRLRKDGLIVIRHGRVRLP